jgi:hypothetical protein
MIAARQTPSIPHHMCQVDCPRPHATVCRARCNLSTPGNVNLRPRQELLYQVPSYFMSDELDLTKSASRPGRLHTRMSVVLWAAAVNFLPEDTQRGEPNKRSNRACRSVLEIFPSCPCSPPSPSLCPALSGLLPLKNPLSWPSHKASMSPVFRET